MDGMLSGSVAVVTGAAQGLGLGIGTQLAKDGATTVITDIQDEKAEAEVTKLREQGLDVHARMLDVTDSSAVTALLDEVAENHGQLDILVNNAGASQTVMPTTELSDEEWQHVLDVTLNGTFYGCRAAGRIMERQESGSIVNIASINGQNPAALVASYNVAKAGVIMLTKTLAIDLAAYGVRVNAVCPGPVLTDFNRKVMQQRAVILNTTEEQMIENVRKAVPLGRWGEPVDIAQGVVFLCSPAACWITGEVLRVSGGMAGLSVAPPKRPKK
jgi:NAD(P)-dependent dehydrogenase (short-subunit alcohol dehydrogenase family)